MKDRSDETVDPFSEGEGGTIEYTAVRSTGNR